MVNFRIWLFAIGFWLLAFGCWLLAVGYWLLAIGFSLLAFRSGLSVVLRIQLAVFITSDFYLLTSNI